MKYEKHETLMKMQENTLAVANGKPEPHEVKDRQPMSPDVGREVPAGDCRLPEDAPGCQRQYPPNPVRQPRCIGPRPRL